jgi:hypothetical protein
MPSENEVYKIVQTPFISRLTRRLKKRVSLDWLYLIHSNAYGRTFGHPFAQFALIISVLSAFFLGLFLSVSAVHGLPDDDIGAAIFIISATLAVVPALGLAAKYLIMLAYDVIMVKKVDKRVGKAISANYVYTGRLSVLLELIEREALTLGESGRLIRLMKSDGRPYYILRITTCLSNEGLSVYGFPRSIYVIVSTAGNDTWDVLAIEHYLFWLRFVRMVSKCPEEGLDVWVISQWISRIVAIANMKERRRSQDG